VLVGSTIGSGIFRSPAGIAGRLPGPLPMLSVWVMGGVFALCGALTLAEVAGALPETGGLYVFIREGWGRLPAFLFGWAELSVIRAAALGAVSTTCAEYAFRLVGRDPAAPPNVAPVHYAAALAIALTAFFNYRGLRWGSLVQNTTAVAKYGGLLFIVIVALAFGFGSGRAAGHFAPVAPPGSFAIAPFGLALVSALWAFDGWADLSFVAGEVADPRVNLPKALIGGTLAVIVIYLLANVAYLAVLPVDQIAHSKLVAADVAQVALGTGGAIFVAATVVLSAFGTLNGSLLTSPRIFFAMAADGLLVRRVAAVHPRYGTPYVAILLSAALGIIFVLTRTFEQLADTFVTAIVPFYALGVASVFMLRRQRGYDPPFRVPGYPYVPALFVLATVYLLVNSLLDPSSRWPTAAVLAVVLAGIPLYRVAARRAGPAGGGRTIVGVALAVALSAGGVHRLSAQAPTAAQPAPPQQPAQATQATPTTPPAADSARGVRAAGSRARSRAHAGHATTARATTSHAAHGAHPMSRHRLRAAYPDSVLETMWPVKGPAPLPGALLPGNRIVAYYGNPLSKRMGILGQIPPDSMLNRLAAEVRAYAAADTARHVVPALDLIVSVAQAAPGTDGKYRLRMPDTLIKRVAGWADRAHALLFLDVQTGRSTVAAELKPLLPYLQRPSVHLALDPEFSMLPGKVPGRVIGTMDAAAVNDAVATLAGLVESYHLPPKVLVVHRFTRPMLRQASAIRLDPRVQVVIDMDGFGPEWMKRDSYRAYVASEPVQYTGFKLFYKNDKPVMSPRQVVGLIPSPLFIMFQ